MDLREDPAESIEVRGSARGEDAGGVVEEDDGTAAASRVWHEIQELEDLAAVHEANPRELLLQKDKDTGDK